MDSQHNIYGSSSHCARHYTAVLGSIAIATIHTWMAITTPLDLMDHTKVQSTGISGRIIIGIDGDKKVCQRWLIFEICHILQGKLIYTNHRVRMLVANTNTMYYILTTLISCFFNFLQEMLIYIYIYIMIPCCFKMHLSSVCATTLCDIYALQAFLNCSYYFYHNDFHMSFFQWS